MLLQQLLELWLQSRSYDVSKSDQNNASFFEILSAENYIIPVFHQFIEFNAERLDISC